MTDLATLGFRVDTSGLAAGASALDQFGAKAKVAGASVAAGADAAKTANTATGAYAKVVGDAANAHAGYSTQAMAAFHATRSMAEGLAMGIPPTQMLAMQMAHLSYAASGPGGLTGAFKDVLGMVTGMLTPMRLMIGSAGLVAGAFYLMYESVKSGEMQFADLQDRIGGTIQQLHALQEAAHFGGGINSDDFIKSMEKFGELSLDATHSIGNLAQLFRANGVAISKDVNANLAHTADLVANAANQQEKYRIIQQAGLPATQQWVQFLSQGGDAILRAVGEANGFGDSAEQQMIRKARDFDTAWAHSWQHFKDYAKTVIIDASQGLDDLIGKAAKWSLGMAQGAAQGLGAGNGTVLKYFGTQMTPGGASSFYDSIFGPGKGPGGSGNGGNPTHNTTDALKAAQDTVAYVAALGELATTEQKVAAKEAQLQIMYLQTGVSVGALRDKILDYVRAQDAAARAQAAVSALGSAATVTEQYDAKLKQLQATLASGIITQDTYNRAVAGLQQDKYIQGLQDTISALGDIAPATLQYELRVAQLKQMLDQGRISQETFNAAVFMAIPGMTDLKNASESAFASIAKDLANGVTLMGALAKAAGQLGSTLIDLGSKQIFNSLFSSLSKTSASGGGFNLSSLAGLFGGASSGPTAVVGGAGSLAVPTFGAAGGAGALGSLGSIMGPLALVGGIGLSLFSGMQQRDEAEKQRIAAAKQAWANAKDAADTFRATMNDITQGTLKPQFQQAMQQYNQFAELAHAAGDESSVHDLQDAYNNFVHRTVTEFITDFGNVAKQFLDGFGPDSPFTKGAASIKQMGDQLRQFVADTATAYADNADSIKAAQVATQAYAKTLLSLPPVLSQTQTELLTAQGGATELGQVLEKLGMTAEDAAKTVDQGLTAAIAQIRDQLTTDLNRQINDAQGKSYINDILDAISAEAQNRSDLASVGGNVTLADTLFRTKVQSIVNGAGLVGDAFTQLIQQFPELAGVVSASTTTLQTNVDTARQALLNSYNQEAQALQQTVSSMNSFITSTEQFRLGLLTNSSSSPLSPSDQYAQSHQQLVDLAAKAAGGDQDAMNQLQSVAQTFLDQSKSFNASNSQYARDFNEVQQILNNAEASARSQISVAQRQLDALNAQVSGLVTLNNTTLSVKDAIDNLAKAMASLDIATKTTTPMTGPGSTPGALPPQDVSQLYTTLLGRSADASGLAYWQAKASAGESSSDLTREFVTAAVANGDSVPASVRAAYGLVNGGMVGNGMYNMDSVVARFAGGGSIMLAGGEFVNRAPSVNQATLPTLQYINQNGRPPSNDNSNSSKNFLELGRMIVGAVSQQTSALEGRLEALTARVAKLDDTTRIAANRRPMPGGKHAA